MNPLLLIYFALRVAVQISGRDSTMKFVETLLAGLREAKDFGAALKELDAEMSRMAAEGRNPTEEEMENLRRRAREATEQILG